MAIPQTDRAPDATPIDPVSGLPSFADLEDEAGETFIGLGGAIGWDPRRARAVEVPGTADRPPLDRVTPLLDLESYGVIAAPKAHGGVHRGELADGEPGATIGDVLALTLVLA